MRSPIRRSLVVALAAGVLATGLAFFLPTPVQAEDGAKNLKVLPKTMSKPEIKKFMKGVATALGVQCDHCHDTDDFPKDTEKKDIARKMMTMASEINTKYFEGKPEVGCITCHNGQKEPKHPGPPK